MARRKVVRKITAARQERVSRLAEIPFVLVSPPSEKTVTFRGSEAAQSAIRSH